MIDYSNIPRDSRRVPLETRVQFKFDRFSGFLSEYSANISPGGMYIQTRAPQAPGSILEFEFRLGDGFELIKGRGEVVWTRDTDDGPARPSGMGIRFLELSQGSKDLIYRIVDHHILQGGMPFDVTQRPPDPIPIPSPAAAPAARAAPPPPRLDLPPAGPEPPADATSWLPALEEPSLPPPLFALAAEEDWMAARNDARNDAWLEGRQSWPEAEPPAESLAALAEPPPAAEPEPPAPMFAASLHGAVERSPRRTLPWILLTAALALAVGAWLARYAIFEMMGLGGEEKIAQTPPPLRRAAEPAPAPREVTPPQASEPGSDSQTPPGPVTEVPAVRPEETAAAAPTPAPPPLPAAPADTGPPATAITKISFEPAFGGTDVVLQGNGAIRSQGYTRTRIDGNPPRELIRLSGIRSPYPAARLAVGTPEVLQIRVGYHPGNELHVVLDLAHPRVKVTRVEEDGNRLRIHLQRE